MDPKKKYIPIPPGRRRRSSESALTTHSTTPPSGNSADTVSLRREVTFNDQQTNQEAMAETRELTNERVLVIKELFVFCRDTYQKMLTAWGTTKASHQIKEEMGRLALWGDSYGVSGGGLDHHFNTDAELKHLRVSAVIPLFSIAKLLGACLFRLNNHILGSTDQVLGGAGYADKARLHRLLASVPEMVDIIDLYSADNNTPEFSLSDAVEGIVRAVNSLFYIIPFIEETYAATEEILTKQKRVPTTEPAADQFRIEAQTYKTDIQHKFQKMDEHLAEVLAGINWSRHRRIREWADNHRGPHLGGGSEAPATSIGTKVSTTGGGDDRSLKAPVFAAPGVPFECSICFKMLDDIDLWEEHMLEDLQPYSCLFSSCPEKTTTFGSKKNWIAHEFKYHRPQYSSEWRCSESCGKSYQQKDELVQHILEDHLEGMAEGMVGASDIDDIVDRCEFRALLQEIDCPFCSERILENEASIQDHVGAHLDEIASMILPKDFRYGTQPYTKDDKNTGDATKTPIITPSKVSTNLTVAGTMPITAQRIPTLDTAIKGQVQYTYGDQRDKESVESGGSAEELEDKLSHTPRATIYSTVDGTAPIAPQIAAAPNTSSDEQAQHMDRSSGGDDEEEGEFVHTPIVAVDSTIDTDDHLPTATVLNTFNEEQAQNMDKGEEGKEEGVFVHIPTATMDSAIGDHPLKAAVLDTSNEEQAQNMEKIEGLNEDTEDEVCVAGAMRGEDGGIMIERNQYSGGRFTSRPREEGFAVSEKGSYEDDVEEDGFPIVGNTLLSVAPIVPNTSGKEQAQDMYQERQTKKAPDVNESSPESFDQPLIVALKHPPDRQIGEHPESSTTPSHADTTYLSASRYKGFNIGPNTDTIIRPGERGGDMSTQKRFEMRPLPPPSGVIDERICHLQDYGLSLEKTKDELAELEIPTVFYDYALDQDWQEIDEDDWHKITKEHIELAAVPLKQIYADDGLNYQHFPKKRATLGGPLFLRIIDFPEIRICGMKGFRSAMIDQMESAMTGLDLMKLTAPAQNPQNNVIFKTGISFSASKPEDSLALMIYMPYFDISPRDPSISLRESLDLSEYKRLESGLDLTSKDINLCSDRRNVLVHQAWLMVFDDAMIAMFRSAEDRHLDSAMGLDQPLSHLRPQPIFPYQERLGAFRALVQIISNILTSSRKRPLIFFREAISQREYEFQNRPRSMADIEGQEKILSKDRQLGIHLVTLAADITTLKCVLQSQIEILKDLKNIYENAVRVGIPVLCIYPKQISSALKMIDKVVKERREFEQKLDDVLGRVERLKGTLNQSLSLQVAEIASQKQLEAHKEQLIIATKQMDASELQLQASEKKLQTLEKQKHFSMRKLKLYRGGMSVGK